MIVATPAHPERQKSSQTLLLGIRDARPTPPCGLVDCDKTYEAERGKTEEERAEKSFHLQKIYGLPGLKHHVVEIRGDVTMRDGRTNEQLKIELLSL